MHDNTFGDALAVALGPGWQRQDDNCHNLILIHEMGYGVWLNEPDRNGRVTVHGEWPQGRFGGAPWGKIPTITVSSTKTPEQIARDITHRFLLAYLPLWQKQKEGQARAEQREAESLRVGRALAAIVGEEYQADRKRLSLAGGSAEISGGEVKLTLHLTPDLAAEILTLWHERTKEEEPCQSAT